MVGLFIRHGPAQASALGPGSRRRHLPSTVLSMHPIALKCCVESKLQTFAEFRTNDEEMRRAQIAFCGQNKVIIRMFLSLALLPLFERRYWGNILGLDNQDLCYLHLKSWIELFKNLQSWIEKISASFWARRLSGNPQGGETGTLLHIDSKRKIYPRAVHLSNTATAC